ncbi:Serine/threonine-protein phosphatase 2A activator 1 [Orbilia oligospora]|uniref:Serine/threonine-protein phosphatase 2A activator n=1 Tax=Orbilia oligospora TaxID=2813651 RepID=A0A7C8PHV0_ORBOL|nr:Serine/threonine-protein phosphatase 2A activator 1 [Orbilia oligospora]KAF3288820.1 Serine/threonine-protein phosphatase 2A activator 1 [Orbilia oligospora]TGJ73858.1 Serine/threonine-protein phosphatase 2A activator 1 [Orbilia oligospora]
MAASLAIPLSTHTFRQPQKLINKNEDLTHFLQSKAHHLIVSYIQHFSDALTPTGSDTNSTESRYADSPAIVVSQPVSQIVELLATIEAIIDEVPPVEGPRRFGNVAFRAWFLTVEQRSPELLRKYLPESIVNTPAKEDGVSALEELQVYLLGGFGSAQRLDYGTGHELSFFAFLCGIWVLGGFEPGRDELALVFKAFDAYLAIIRKLVLTYSLEPAGSHGVWGLDDHSFLPYIFGSAQLAATPEGMGPPAPGSIVEANTVERERNRNMYFGAIGFIRDVKKGPFWEHSPYLYDISGAIGGWKKINLGMMKMYAAEVLGKFPVVQHFPFGSIFSWDLVEGAKLPPGFPSFSATAATSSSTMPPPTLLPGGGEEGGTKAPWSTLPSDSSKNLSAIPPTTRMRASTPISQSNLANRVPVSSLRGPPMGMPPPSRPNNTTPPHNITLNPETTTTVPVPGGFAPAIGGIAVTTAPWAKPPTGPSGFGKGSGGGEAVGRDPTSPDSVTGVDAPVRRVRSGSVTVGETGSLAGGKVVEYTNSHNQDKEEEK